jgi:2-C-methyl-D-erythritol 4-phosphate cytidylyltransferase
VTAPDADLADAHVPRFFGLIPAAGTGTRIGDVTPKQYLALAGKPMLAHAIAALAADARIEAIVVVVAANDTRWRDIDAPAHVEFVAAGGVSRFVSVRNGLRALATRAHADDWVLVHDAARPCLSAPELASLIDALQDDDVGGLLALPLADTLKQAQAQRVERTLPRGGLWRAQTPQMFRHGVLLEACDRVRAGDDEPTDEAMAIERCGLRPRLVAGAATNIKVTHAADRTLAEAILAAAAARHTTEQTR